MREVQPPGDASERFSGAKREEDRDKHRRPGRLLAVFKGLVMLALLAVTAYGMLNAGLYRDVLWLPVAAGILGLLFVTLFVPGFYWDLPSVGILLVRRNLPESPRWQVMNGRTEEAEASIDLIEREVRESGQELPPVDESKAMEVKPADKIGYLALTKVLFRDYPRRAVLGASLMISQSFL